MTYEEVKFEKEKIDKLESIAMELKRIADALEAHQQPVNAGPKEPADNHFEWLDGKSFL